MYFLHWSLSFLSGPQISDTGRISPGWLFAWKTCFESLGYEKLLFLSYSFSKRRLYFAVVIIWICLMSQSSKIASEQFIPMVSSVGLCCLLQALGSWLHVVKNVSEAKASQLDVCLPVCLCNYCIHPYILHITWQFRIDIYYLPAKWN